MQSRVSASRYCTRTQKLYSMNSVTCLFSHSIAQAQAYSILIVIEMVFEVDLSNFGSYCTGQTSNSGLRKTHAGCNPICMWSPSFRIHVRI